MRTRLYLKARPADDSVSDLLKLEQDEFGWYYSTGLELELLELPLGIAPENVRKVTVRIDLTLGLSDWSRSMTVTWDQATGVYRRDQLKASMEITSATLSDAQNLWKYFQYGAPLPPGMTPPAPRRSTRTKRTLRQRIWRAGAVLIGRAD